MIKLLKKIFEARYNNVMERFNEKEIIKDSHKTNFFGLESWGLKQVRGNGILVLTEKELFFGMFKPAKDISIPINSIKQITTSEKSHLKKKSIMRLLKIIFTQNGKDDVAAWQVTDIDDWEAKIRKLVKKP